MIPVQGKGKPRTLSMNKITPRKSIVDMRRKTISYMRNNKRKFAPALAGGLQVLELLGEEESELSLKAIGETAEISARVRDRLILIDQEEIEHGFYRLLASLIHSPPLRHEKAPFCSGALLCLVAVYYYSFPLSSNFGQGMLAFTSCAAVHLTLWSARTCTKRSGWFLT
jgi:hypothetical protein